MKMIDSVTKLIDASGGEPVGQGDVTICERFKIQNVDAILYLEKLIPLKPVKLTLNIFSPGQLLEYIGAIEPAYSAVEYGWIPIASEPSGDLYLLDGKKGSVELVWAGTEVSAEPDIIRNSSESFSSLTEFFNELCYVLEI